MAGHDEQLDLERIRGVRGGALAVWTRRLLLAVLAVPVVLALTGALGQPTKTLVSAGARARLQVELPDALRGGLMWRTRIVVRAAGTIMHPRIVLGPGFAHGMQVNTIEPSPVSEASRGPEIVLSYDTLDAAGELVVYVQLQVNPTTLGDQDTSVELDDESLPLARIAHTTTVLP